jgi:hypothetical protein
MNRTRQLTAPNQQGPRSPTTSGEWNRLMAHLIERAHRLGRPTSAMQAAYSQGKAEDFLRKASILTPTCIDREYPDK